MSKSFGKIVIASTIIAGAAVGAYSYYKKNCEEATDETVPETEGEDTIKTADSFAAKARNYVDLASTKLEKPMAEAKEAVAGAKDVMSGAFSEAKSAMSDVAKEVKVAVSGAAKEIKEVVAEAKANAASESTEEDVIDITESVSEEVVDKVVEAVDEVVDKVADEAPQFEQGLQAKNIEEAGKVIGSESSEEFFDDESEE